MFGNFTEHWPWRLGRHYEAAAAAGWKERGRGDIQTEMSKHTATRDYFHHQQIFSWYTDSSFEEFGREFPLFIQTDVFKLFVLSNQQPENK